MKKIIFVLFCLSFFISGSSQQVLNSKNIAVSQLEKKADSEPFIVLDSANTAGQVVIVKSRSNGFRVRTKGTMSTLEKKKMVEENAVVIGTKVAARGDNLELTPTTETQNYSSDVNGDGRFVFKEGKTFIEKSGELVAFSGELSKEGKDQQELSKKLKTGLFIKKDENTYRIYGPTGIYKGTSPFK